MLKTLVYALAGVALLVVAAAAAWYARGLEPDEASSPRPSPLVDVVRPVAVEAPPAIVETGFVRAAERVNVAPEAPGRIVEIGEKFALGSMVKAGDLLIQLDASTIRTQISRAEADLQSAQAAEAQASASLLRREELAEDDYVAQNELERAQADAAAARARVLQAQAALEAARLRLDDSRLRAPFDALVIAEDASPGQLLQVGAPIGTLVASNVAEIRLGLNERDFGRLRRGGDLVGRQVTIERDGAESLQGTISAAAPVLAGRARTVEIVVEVADPFAQGRELVLNSLVRVVIPLPDADTPLYRLPAGALQTGERLWRVTADSTLERVHATVQRRGDDAVFVQSGALRPDDRILRTALPNPLPGLQVRVRAPEEDSGGGAQP